MQLIKAKAIAQQVQGDVAAAAGGWIARGSQPRLAVLLVGSDPGSRWYAEAKVKLGARLGIAVDVDRLRDNAATAEVVGRVDEYSRDVNVHGILVELPLPGQIDKAAVLAAIDPRKDVDCVCPSNRGRLFSGDEEGLLLPATPQACLELVASVVGEFSGRRAVVVGRGDTVGRPLAAMLLTRHATVTICHTRTRELARITREAELLFAAAGRPGLITGAMVSPAAIVADAGINEVADQMVGDVDANSVGPVARAFTPVPGGVGGLTTTLLMRNVLRALENQRAGLASVG